MSEEPVHEFQKVRKQIKLSPKTQNAHEQPYKAINGSEQDFVIEEAKQKPGRPDNERASLGEFTKNQRDLDSALE